jgi:hypothetical protein
MAQALREPISDELPGLVRLVGLDMLGATLSNSEDSQLLVGRTRRRESFSSIFQGNCLIVFAVQD